MKEKNMTPSAILITMGMFKMVMLMVPRSKNVLKTERHDCSVIPGGDVDLLLSSGTLYKIIRFVYLIFLDVSNTRCELINNGFTMLQYASDTWTRYLRYVMCISNEYGSCGFRISINNIPFSTDKHLGWEQIQWQGGHVRVKIKFPVFSCVHDQVSCVFQYISNKYFLSKWPPPLLTPILSSLLFHNKITT